MDEYRQAALEFGGRALGAVCILLVGWLALRYALQPLRRLLERSRVDPAAASFLANTVRAALVVVILLAAVQQLGVSTTPLLTVLGTIGLALALSLQGSLANFASGLLVLSFRMVRLGDTVEVGDVRGRVAELLPFHVVLVTADNQRVTLPNSVLTNGPVRNHSALPTRRSQWSLPLAAADDLAAVKAALMEQLRADPRVLAEPEPQLFVQDWADDKRALTVQAWTVTADHAAVQQGMLEELVRRLAEVRRSVTTP